MPSKLLRRLRRLLPDQRGNVAMVVAAVFPLLIAAAGLAIDGVEWMLQKREIQAAADGAAMAGVYSLISSQDLENAVSRTAMQTGNVPENASIQAAQGPPGHENDPFAVAVTIAAPAQMTFSSMFMKHPPVISAVATATVVKNGRYCAFALGDMDDESGVVLRPNSEVQADCGVSTNASGKRALEADGESTIQAKALRSYGSIGDQQAALKSGMREHALMQDDPLADTDPPLVPNTGCPNITINPDAKETALDPGCYANMILNGPVRLQDGEYILNKGNFIVGPHGHVSCDACTIFLTSETAATDAGSIGKVDISSDATVQMSATREGPNAGILFYQDRHAATDLPGGENRLGGSSFSKLNGLIYFPSQTVYVDGNMHPDIQCTRFIARRLVFAGQVYIGESCDGLDKVTFAVTEVRLVE
ncbi:MAG TPA: pilus assembly protein TadG-related protein [Sphingomicrobium sp.]|nr:pilus assembly protein TadG-related protein [Sphingomicrobium sp.]HWJ58715.1 pilus assembly protein TadG-related protein [Sphingomicrobium sp.]